eukprot:CAMPEP_0195288504 /NCGR_PEP_ID=MMETSP0707-20130614/5146_1 /TAXON_ID=33640 /ORGANISM="Asterionellopsis glacialis, Strain CCMP134" /LENGTH=545 /DNA_ID=CAMNT_0040348383 /DNA_START=443 /DNA_END=2080 /DNA_ORIENTATION=+
MNRRGMKPSPNLLPRGSNSKSNNDQSKEDSSDKVTEKAVAVGSLSNRSIDANAAGIPRVRSTPSLIHQGRRQRRGRSSRGQQQLNLLLSYQVDELEKSTSSSASSAFSPTKEVEQSREFLVFAPSDCEYKETPQNNMYEDDQSNERRSLCARSASSKRDRRAALENLMKSRSGSITSATPNTCGSSVARSPVLSSTGNSPTLIGSSPPSMGTSPPGSRMHSSAPTTPRVSPMLLSRYPSSHSMHSLGGFVLDSSESIPNNASSGGLQHQHQLSHSPSYRSLRSGTATEGFEVIRATSPSMSSDHSLNRNVPTEIVTVSQPRKDHNQDTSGRKGTEIATAASAAATTTSNINKRARSVSFDKVEIRCYERTIGDHPSCSSGPSVSIGWKYEDSTKKYEVDNYEIQRPQRKKEYELILTRQEREDLLRNLGYNRFDIAESVRGIIKVKKNRRQTINNLGAEKFEETLERARRKIKKILPFHHHENITTTTTSSSTLANSSSSNNNNSNTRTNQTTTRTTMETGFKHNKGNFLSRHRQPQSGRPIDAQ